MSLEISVRERPAVRYVGIPVTARLSEFGAADGPNAMIPRIYQWLADHAIAPRGGPLYVYRHTGAADEPVDLTVAVPIAEPVRPTGGLVHGSLPAGVYIIGRHTGSPDGIPASQAAVQRWAREHGHGLGTARADDGTLWTGYAEHFLTDPSEEPDASQWVTELLFKTD